MCEKLVKSFSCDLFTFSIQFAVRVHVLILTLLLGAKHTQIERGRKWKIERERETFTTVFQRHLCASATWFQRKCTKWKFMQQCFRSTYPVNLIAATRQNLRVFFLLVQLQRFEIHLMCLLWLVKYVSVLITRQQSVLRHSFCFLPKSLSIRFCFVPFKRKMSLRAR